MQDREGQVLQLPLDRGHAQPVRQRRHHLERLARLLGLLLRGQEAHRAHVVQPVGQLDDQHPRVPRHRDDHLADRLGLGRVAELDLLQLRDAVDEVGHLVAELRAQAVQRVVGVLDGVVQQRGDERRGVHAQLGQDRGDGERMGDVRIAGLALLPRVLGLGHLVRAHQQPEVRLRVQRTVHARQRLQHGRHRRDALRRHAAGDARSYPAGGGGAHAFRTGDRRRRGLQVGHAVGSSTPPRIVRLER